MRILNSLIVPKYIKGETFWAFWHLSLLQNIGKNLKVGPFQGKKIEKKLHSAEEKLKQSHSAKKIARKSFWLKQGLEPVTTGFTVNRLLTSTRERE